MDYKWPRNTASANSSQDDESDQRQAEDDIRGGPMLKLKVITGPGVYIRSLARDIGKELGTGGYLAELERTRVGQFTKEKAIPLEKFNSNIKL